MGLPYHDTIKQQKLLRFGDKNKSKSKSSIPLRPKKEVSSIPVHIVDAMKVVRMIPAINLSPPTYETWAINVFNYMNGLPGLVCHVVFNIYPGHVDFSRPSKGRYDSIGERRYIYQAYLNSFL